jgi:hypothetical protein
LSWAAVSNSAVIGADPGKLTLLFFDDTSCKRTFECVKSGLNSGKWPVPSLIDFAMTGGCLFNVDAEMAIMFNPLSLCFGAASTSEEALFATGGRTRRSFSHKSSVFARPRKDLAFSSDVVAAADWDLTRRKLFVLLLCNLTRGRLTPSDGNRTRELFVMGLTPSDGNRTRELLVMVLSR